MTIIKNKQIHLRVTNDEHKKIKDNAKLNNVAISHYILSSCLPKRHLGEIINWKIIKELSEVKQQLKIANEKLQQTLQISSRYDHYVFQSHKQRYSDLEETTSKLIHECVEAMTKFDNG